MLYTLGLPAPMRDRRLGEIAADLDEEQADAVRRHTQSGLRRQRLVRLVLGAPDDLVWRFVDAPTVAPRYRTPTPWVPLDRWTALLMGVVAIGASGGLALVAAPYLSGRLDPSTWLGWGPAGFIVGCIGVLVALSLAVPWPGRGAALMLPTLVVGMAAAPWLWGCWVLSAMAVGLRWHQAAAAD
jgi:hypothetical protein